MNRRDLRKPYPFHSAAFDTAFIRRAPRMERIAQPKRIPWITLTIIVTGLVIAARCLGV